MRLTRLLGATLGTGLLFLALSSGANAWDGWRDRDHWRYGHYHRYEHWRHERPIVVRERPVIVQRAPVYVAPPMYAAPMYNPGPSGVNLNFNIPLN